MKKVTPLECEEDKTKITNEGKQLCKRDLSEGEKEAVRTNASSQRESKNCQAGGKEQN